MVTGPSSSPAGFALNHARYFETGSSRRSLPSSRSCMIAIAVNSLLCDAMRNFVVAVIGTFALMSAKPKPEVQTNCWSLTTPTAMPGSPRYAICPSIHAEKSRSAPRTSGSAATLVTLGFVEAACAESVRRGSIDATSANATQRFMESPGCERRGTRKPRAKRRRRQDRGQVLPSVLLGHRAYYAAWRSHMTPCKSSCYNAESGNRTHMGIAPRRILSPTPILAQA